MKCARKTPDIVLFLTEYTDLAFTVNAEQCLERSSESSSKLSDVPDGIVTICHGYICYGYTSYFTEAGQF